MSPQPAFWDSVPARRTTTTSPPPDGGRGMPIETMYEVMACFTEVLAHTQYAISGTSALAAYGYDGKMPSEVSIITPQRDKDVVMSWALTSTKSSIRIDAFDRDVLLVPTRDGVYHRVRVTCWENSLAEEDDDAEPSSYFAPHVSHDMDLWEDFDIMSLRLKMHHVVEGKAVEHVANAKILSLAALAEVLARRCVENEIAEHEMADMTTEMNWILRRIVELDDARCRFSDRTGTSVLNPLFWVPFTAVGPESVGLFEECGIARDRVSFDPREPAQLNHEPSSGSAVVVAPTKGASFYSSSSFSFSASPSSSPSYSPSPSSSSRLGRASSALRRTFSMKKSHVLSPEVTSSSFSEGHRAEENASSLDRPGYCGHLEQRRYGRVMSIDWQMIPAPLNDESQ